MMMTMYSLHSTPPHSPCRHLLATAALQDGCHVDSANCCLISIILGVTMEKVSTSNNTIQYLQILPSTQLFIRCYDLPSSILLHNSFSFFFLLKGKR